MAGPTRLAARVPPWLSGLLVSAVWLVLVMKLVPWGVKLVPDSLKPKITYQQFLATCQALTLVIGIALTKLLTREPRQELGATRPRLVHLVEVTLLAPVTFVVTSFVALRIALPYLLEELATRGHGVAREEAGEMGRQLQQAPLLFTLLWGALLAAAGEELLFRGVLWSALARLVPKPKAPDAPPDSLMADFARPSPAVKWLRDAAPGLVATTVSAGLFGALHHDMKGSVGVVHVAATTCLGLASGTARHVTGGVAASVLMHFLYNVTVIGNSRHWFGFSDEPILNGIPDSLVFAACAGAVVCVGIVVANRRRAEVAPPAPTSAPG